MQGQRTATRRGARVAVLVAVAVAAVIGLVAAVSGNVRPQPSPMQTVDTYLRAVQQGDRAALENVVDPSAPGRAALLERHVGRPAAVSRMTFTAMPSDAWWDLVVEYDAYSNRLPAEHLTVHPGPSGGWAVGP